MIHLKDGLDKKKMKRNQFISKVKLTIQLELRFESLYLLFNYWIIKKFIVTKIRRKIKELTFTKSVWIVYPKSNMIPYRGFSLSLFLTRVQESNKFFIKNKYDLQKKIKTLLIIWRTYNNKDECTQFLDKSYLFN